MKRLLLSMVLIGLYASVSFGEIVFDYTISDTYEFGTFMLDGESLLVTGAGADAIEARGESYIDCARKGNGYLLVPRDGVLYMPLAVIQDFIPEAAFEKDTVDIFLDFGSSEVLLKYHRQVLDVTEYRLLG
jgi:hypothetical protein